MNARSFPWTESIIMLVAIATMIFVTRANYLRQEASAPRFDTFSSYDARKGGYQAWYELLGREGMSIERFEQRPAFLDASVATLIIAPNTRELRLRMEKTGEAAGAMQDIDYESLQAWVKRGGHLIWLSDGTQDTRLSAPLVQPVGPARDEAVTVAVSPFTKNVSAVSGTSKLRVPFTNSAAMSPLIADGAGSVVGQFRLGKGDIIVVTDQNLFDNAHIARADNARLAYNLVAGGRRGTVAFDEWVHGYVSGRSAWALLPKPAQAAVVIVVVGLMLLLVATTLRFGPTARLPENAERTSAEYLSSMASLLARGKAARKALRDLASVTLHDVAGSLGLSERAKISDVIARVEFGDPGSDQAGRIRELERLSTLDRPSDADLVRAGVLCAQLRKDFVRYGRIGFGRRPTPVRRSA